MFGKQKWVRIVLLAAMLTMLVAPVAGAQFSPTIFVVDQDVVDGNVTVTRAASDGPGWLAIWNDADGEPDQMIGFTEMPGGIIATTDVGVDASLVTPLLWAAVHVDDGDGAFDSETDAIAEVNGARILASFNVGEVASSLLTVAAENDLASFFEAVEAAGLAQELVNGGPYTVFAPSNAAFDAASDVVAPMLSDPEQLEALTTVLLSHVVPGVMPSSAFTESQELVSAAGTVIPLEVTDSGVSVGGASIESADLEAYNGVLHVIDAVLLPAGEEEAAEEAAEEVVEEATVEATEAVTETVEAVATEEPVEETAEETAEAAATEEPVEEAAAAEATAEPMEEAAEAAADEKGADVAATPESLPATGAADSPVASMLAAGFVLLALAVFAALFRRRTA